MVQAWQRVALLLGLLWALPACGPSSPTSTSGNNAGSTLASRPKGQWQNTQIQIQRFKNLLFRNKADGSILNPQSAAGLPQEQVLLETGDWDELLYERGRLRHTSFPRERAAQAVVVDRIFSESEFEALDQALWADPFFKSEQKNWDANTRLPMYYLRYQQQGKGHEASFAPSMSKLGRTARLTDVYFRQLSGEAPPPAGVKHVLYLIALAEGQCEVKVSELKAAGSDSEELPLPLAQVKVDLGSGSTEAKLSAKGFSFPAPQSKGDVAVLVEIQPKEGSPWTLSIPVRNP